MCATFCSLSTDRQTDGRRDRQTDGSTMLISWCIHCCVIKNTADAGAMTKSTDILSRGRLGSTAGCYCCCCCCCCYYIRAAYAIPCTCAYRSSLQWWITASSDVSRLRTLYIGTSIMARNALSYDVCVETIIHCWLYLAVQCDDHRKSYSKLTGRLNICLLYTSPSPRDS